MKERFRSTATAENLRLRADLLRSLRTFFDARGFVEVQTPVISYDTVIDRHIEPITISENEITGRTDCKRKLYLQTSPEFAMKRLLVDGLQAIYQVCPVFRGGERGPNHNPEFTMAEWYQVGHDLDEGVGLLVDLATHLLSPHVRTTLAPVVLTYSEAFKQFADADPLESSCSDLSRIAVQKGLVSNVDWADDWDDWTNLIFSHLVQPRLGFDGLTVVTHFPASQAALAQVDSRDSRVAERFELFYHGVELANGFHELLDPAELRRRNSETTLQRRRDGKPDLPQESLLLEAMDHGLPESTGCAMGFDRIVMLACGGGSLDEVIAFPIERA